MITKTNIKLSLSDAERRKLGGIFSQTLFILTFFTGSLQAQPPVANVLDSGEVPFEMVKNAIIVPVTINGGTYRFVLDTGGFFTISKTVSERENFERTGTVTVSDINKREKVFDKVKVDELAMGQLTFTNREAIVVSENDTYPERCFGTDGMIGRDFFKGVVLHFDYRKKMLRLTEDRSVLDLKEYYKTAMRTSERGIPDVLLTVNGKKQFIEFDSGSGDFFSFKTKTAGKLRIRSDTDRLKFKGIFSYGVSSRGMIKPTKRYKVKVNRLDIGTTRFENFYSDFSKKTEPRIGAGLLYFGKVTVDFKSKGFYFEPYYPPATLPSLASFGFDIVYLNEEYLIKWVLASSAAAKAGLKFGLKVKAINGTPVEDITEACEGYVNGYGFEAGDRVTLTYWDKQGKIRSVELQKVTYE